MLSVKKKRIILLLLVVLLVAGGSYGVLSFRGRRHAVTSITLYGNVDIRQVQLAFNDSERIDKILVDEGSKIRAGQLVAQLVGQRFTDAVTRSQANVAAQQQVVARLLAGSRPEEIAEARANVAAAEADVTAAQADLVNAELLYRRQQTLARQQYVSLQLRDDAQRAYLAQQASVNAKKQVLAAREQALQLAVIGPRREDIAAAQATLQADKATLALAAKELADTQLYAPADGVIQNRILEPGDMVTPQAPVLTLALDNPVWVRAYLPEPEMGRVALGMRAWVESDSFPGQRFMGWIGFISPVSEFTPKNVETTQLRSQLVYRVRVYACNPDHRLRLGMPATVVIPIVDNPAHAIDPHPCEKD
ncbi:efflux RND transporter periplasmic adaptor subunit [Acidipila rosea]|uniref:HlyD family secretion protein n=1 Tax=Acidipila rosea TaxID=768535 RepID=A0A4R1L9R9_9BACT|nr:efflux RND transporter periplasmic adaptor subunit [Acidipila rosea]TCK74010.1 HlyD family secretion protein [Acidipila rosea]